jgi:hypothetical protein
MRALVAHVAVLMLTACAGQTASSQTTPKATGAQSLTVAKTLISPRQAGEIDHIGVFSHYVTWVAAALKPETVQVYDLRSRTETSVATGSTSQALLDFPRGAGDTLTYMELPKVPNDADPETTWRMFAINLLDKSRRLLLSSQRPVSYLLAPIPQLDGHWIAWAEETPNSQPISSQVVTYDLTTGIRRVLVEHLTTELVGITEGKVVYQADSGPGGRDIFEVPADGSGVPVQITKAGNAVAPVAGGGWVAWMQRGVSGYESLLAQPLSGSATPIRIAGPNQGNPALGSGYIAWLSQDGDLMARRLVGGVAPSLQLEPSSKFLLPARLGAAGDLLSWARATDQLADPPIGVQVVVAHVYG